MNERKIHKNEINETTTRDISMEGLAAWVPKLRPKWIIVVIKPIGPTALKIRGEIK
jgi:hypothetical protein